MFKAAAEDTALKAFPCLHADVVLLHLDRVFNPITHSSKDTPSNDWDNLRSRDEADNPHSLAVKTVNAFLKKIEGRQWHRATGAPYDETTVFSDELCEMELNRKYAELLLADPWRDRGMYLHATYSWIM